MKIKKDFFLQDAVTVAQKLIGKYLCCKINGRIFKKKITETEAYFGFEDSASHAYKGKTKRNEPMFEEGGITYVYLCYGIHNLLNIVTGIKEHPEAVLIRGIEGYNGPGKLTKYLGITKDENRIDICASEIIWIEDNENDNIYQKKKRIGIGYAKEKDQERLWRFVIKEQE